MYSVHRTVTHIDNNKASACDNLGSEGRLWIMILIKMLLLLLGAMVFSGYLKGSLWSLFDLQIEGSELH